MYGTLIILRGTFFIVYGITIILINTLVFKKTSSDLQLQLSMRFFHEKLLYKFLEKYLTIIPTRNPFMCWRILFKFKLSLRVSTATAIAVRDNL